MSVTRHESIAMPLGLAFRICSFPSVFSPHTNGRLCSFLCPMKEKKMYIFVEDLSVHVHVELFGIFLSFLTKYLSWRKFFKPIL
jgi:hypothetical protein